MAVTTYKQAGVDIAAADRLKSRLGALVGATHGPEVVSDMAGFCSLFRLPAGYREPVLVAATDGVGTKALVAQVTGRLSGLGQDLVAMCVNDLVTCGARPLFFLDYLALDRFDAAEVESLIASIAAACGEVRMALVGGETAQMPGVYLPGKLDLAGFCVGVVERAEILGPERVRAGDVLLGLPSSGLHSNGYSLVRAVFGDRPSEQVEDLLAPTRLYPAAVAAATAAGEVHAIAHITGGGLPGNVPRILPEGLRARLFADRWRVPAICERLARRGGVEHEEMVRTFNMGLGLVLAVEHASAAAILAAAEGGALAGLAAVGEVVEGSRGVEIRGVDAMMLSIEGSPRAAVLASGRGSNFGALARAFAAGEIPGTIELLVVDKPRVGAIEIASRFGIPALYIEPKKRQRAAFDTALLRALAGHEIDYVFLAGFMRILSRPVVEAYWGRILNIHPSLLPKFPGLHPHAQVLAARVRQSGCTVHFVDFGVDSGPIVLQRRVPVRAGDDEETLAARILEQEHIAYPEAARLLLAGEVRLEGGKVVRGKPARKAEQEAP